MTDKVIEPCKHTHYVVSFALTTINNVVLETNQPFVKFKILCRDCKTPCTFGGEFGLNADGPSISDDETSLFAPIAYPTVLKKEYPVEEADDEKEDDEKKKVYH